MAVDRKKKVSMTIREEVSFCGRHKLQNNAWRDGVKTNFIGKGAGEEGEMLVHVIVWPQFVRADNPRGDNRVAKCGLWMEVEKTLSDDVEPF